MIEKTTKISCWACGKKILPGNFWEDICDKCSQCDSKNVKIGKSQQIGQENARSNETLNPISPDSQ